MLSKILYEKNATVYIAGRSQEKCAKAIESIERDVPKSTGKLVFLKLDLADLSTIKASAEEFLSKEKRLDVLWNNAGVMWPPEWLQVSSGQPFPIKSRITQDELVANLPSSQDYELQFGTNCLGPFLFTQLLHPILKSTAASSPANSVRVCWAGSLGIDAGAPKGGIDMDETGAPKVSTSAQTNY